MFIFGLIIFPKVNFDSECLGFVIFVSLGDVLICKEWVLTSGLWTFPNFFLGISNK